jgi:hypothetical protein
MASIEKVRQVIADIAQRRKNVTASEIEWVMGQLKTNGLNVRDARKTRHGVLYAVDSVRFQICTHNPGSKQVRSCYVDDFVDAMTELGLYED